MSAQERTRRAAGIVASAIGAGLGFSVDPVPGLRCITVTLDPMRLVSLLNVREHRAPRARRAAEQRAVARMAVMVPLRRSVLRERLAYGSSLEVVITRIASGSLDSDNLVCSAKHVRDGIADALGVDDADPRVEWHVRGEKARRGTWAVRIEISEVEVTPC